MADKPIIAVVGATGMQGNGLVQAILSDPRSGYAVREAGTEMAAVLTKHLGQEIRYNAVSPEVYRDLGFPGADDLGNMFQFKHDFNEAFCGARDVAAARSLNPALQGFDEWVRANKDRIPLS